MNWYRFTPVKPASPTGKYPLPGEREVEAINQQEAVKLLKRHCFGLLDMDSFSCAQFDPDEEWEIGFKEFLKRHPKSGVDYTNGWAKTQGGNDF